MATVVSAVVFPHGVAGGQLFPVTRDYTCDAAIGEAVGEAVEIALAAGFKIVEPLVVLVSFKDEP